MRFVISPLTHSAICEFGIIAQMFSSFLRRLIFSLVILGLAFQASADWINLSGSEAAPNIAEIHVMDDHIRLVLEVYVGDLKLFEDLLPIAVAMLHGEETAISQDLLPEINALLDAFEPKAGAELEQAIKKVKGGVRDKSLFEKLRINAD